MIAAITALAPILNASAVELQTVKYLGGADLLSVAWQTLCQNAHVKVDESFAPVSFWRVIRSGRSRSLRSFRISFRPAMRTAHGTWSGSVSCPCPQR
jgi:threonine/homoserine/homoserine lactone efflux protein